jgi:hypothetical protein
MYLIIVSFKLYQWCKNILILQKKITTVQSYMYIFVQISNKNQPRKFEDIRET